MTDRNNYRAELVANIERQARQGRVQALDAYNTSSIYAAARVIDSFQVILDLVAEYQFDVTTHP